MRLLRGRTFVRLVLCIVLGGVLAVGAAGCASPNEVAPGYPGGWSEGDEESGYTPGAPVPTIAPGVPSTGDGQTPAKPSDGSVSTPDRMVVRNGSMELVVDDVTAVAQDIGRLAATFDGHVVSSSLYEDNGRTFGTVVVRVDADRFDSALAALRGLAVEVVRETTSSTDVTEEYVDLTAQRRNLQSTEAKLLALLERAGSVEELLEVQRELSRVRGEIEQLEGRIRYLEQTSASSLIEVYLRESILTVSFAAESRAVDEGKPVMFDSEVSGGFTPYTYEWDFGDGGTSTEANPSYIYRDEGLYGVRLTVTDDKGASETEYRDYYIQVSGVWSPGGAFRDAARGLGSLGRGLAGLLIWLVVFSPVWAGIAAITILVYRRAMRGHRATQGGKKSA
ncbi:MAG: DUF4349 domain-containing protein [Dehalococcoidia bacterium]|nr:DUF4349 domain-containing protein [Dehalococcoidia bacterium]